MSILTFEYQKKMTMDVLSDVLGTVRLTGSIFFTANFYEPWTILAPTHNELLQQLPSTAECISFFHIITEGECQLKTIDGEPFSLQKGSVIIFPHSCAHIMGSTMEREPVPAIELNVFEGSKRFSDVEFGGKGDKTQFICGYLLCDQRFNPLLGAVPEVLILMPDQDRFSSLYPGLRQFTLPIVPNGWLEMTLNRLIEEVQNKHAGSTTIATRLTELMYVEVLRGYMNDLPENSCGWLAGVRDPEVGKALRILHAHPEIKWTVSELATKVGVSRSALARRFSELIGESPMKYLTDWRMQIAKSLLFQPLLSMAMVAEKVGYESEYAFSKAFKRCVGVPPGFWRDHIGKP